MTRDEAGRQVIATAIEIIKIVKIPVIGAKLGWDSCGGDNGGPPFQAVIDGGIPGKPTDAEATAQVDAWVKLLEAHGWTFQVLERSGGMRSGGNGKFGLQLLPYNSVTIKGPPGVSFSVNGKCVVPTDLPITAQTGPDVTDIITGKAPNIWATQPIPTFDPTSHITASPTN